MILILLFQFGLFVLCQNNPAIPMHRIHQMCFKLLIFCSNLIVTWNTLRKQSYLSYLILIWCNLSIHRLWIVYKELHLVRGTSKSKSMFKVICFGKENLFCRPDDTWRQLSVACTGAEYFALKGNAVEIVFLLQTPGNIYSLFRKVWVHGKNWWETGQKMKFVIKTIKC